MARNTTFANRVMLENKRSTLGSMALQAGLVSRQESEPAATNRLLKIGAAAFDRIPLVRVVAIDAAHLVFEHRMMMWQLELRPDLQVTLETGVGRFQRVNDVAAAATGLDVFAAGSVTRLASHRLCVLASGR